MYIEKLGQNKYGYWALFEYANDNLIIKGIANTKLTNLQQEKLYDNLALEIINKNQKTYYNIVEK